jgi:ABC-type Mn2+/Zn2+ transport system ATPase subunit
MPHFDIIRECKPEKTFRVESVMGTFDLQTEHIKEHFVGNIEPPEKWNVGLIVGRSGSGKTTIARELFGAKVIEKYNYTHESILDDMPKSATMQEITAALNSVGFSSPPSWLKPYSALSNGERMRCDIARAMLENDDFFVFDEFTSVVDRNVAQISSFAIQKAIRKRGGAVYCGNVSLRRRKLAHARLGIQYGHNDVSANRRRNAKKKSTSHRARHQRDTKQKTRGLANVC